MQPKYCKIYNSYRPGLHDQIHSWLHALVCTQAVGTSDTQSTGSLDILDVCTCDILNVKSGNCMPFNTQDAIDARYPCMFYPWTDNRGGASLVMRLITISTREKSSSKSSLHLRIDGAEKRAGTRQRWKNARRLLNICKNTQQMSCSLFAFFHLCLVSVLLSAPLILRWNEVLENLFPEFLFFFEGFLKHLLNRWRKRLLCCRQTLLRGGKNAFCIVANVLVLETNVLKARAQTSAPHSYTCS